MITRAGAPVYVDYAHTPDAIEAAIEALRPHAEGPADHRLRRRRRPRPGKRAEMGAAAARLADRVIVTDDNPRERGSGRDPPRHPGRRAGRDRGRRPARGDPRRDRRGRAGRHRPARRQGPRAGPDRRRPRCFRSTTSTVAREMRGMTPRSGPPPRSPTRDRRRSRRMAISRRRRGVDLRFARGRAGRPVHRAEGRGDRRPSFVDQAFAAGAAGALVTRADRRTRTSASPTRCQALERSRPGRRARAAAQDRRRHRLGRQDRDQGGAVRGARPRRAGPGAPLGQELQQPYRRAAEPRPDAARRAIRRVRDGHEPCRRARRADPAGAAARRHRHHDRAGAPRIFASDGGDRRRQGRDLPGAGARRHRDHPL